MAVPLVILRPCGARVLVKDRALAWGFLLEVARTPAAGAHSWRQRPGHEEVDGPSAAGSRRRRRPRRPRPPRSRHGSDAGAEPTTNTTNSSGPDLDTTNDQSQTQPRHFYIGELGDPGQAQGHGAGDGGVPDQPGDLHPQTRILNRGQGPARARPLDQDRTHEHKFHTRRREQNEPAALLDQAKAQNLEHESNEYKFPVDLDQAQLQKEQPETWTRLPAQARERHDIKPQACIKSPLPSQDVMDYRGSPAQPRWAGQADSEDDLAQAPTQHQRTRHQIRAYLSARRPGPVRARARLLEVHTMLQHIEQLEPEPLNSSSPSPRVARARALE